MNSHTAMDALEACEKGLCKALAEAGAAGDYDAVRQVMAWAEEIKAMVAAARAPSIHPVPLALSAKASAPRVTGKARMIQDEYPRFLRRGDELVKVGWSKRENKEYSHRAPRRALDAVIAAVKRLTAQGAAFASEDLSPLKDPEGGVFPTYQIFVALAWLRRLGLIHQPGRKSNYSLVPGKGMDATIEAQWKQLEGWKG